MSKLAKEQIQARTTLPTAKLDGEDMKLMGDKYGRQVMLPYTVRELISTARATLTSELGFGTPTALLTGIAGTNLDLVFMSIANSSDAATTLVLSDDGTTVRTFTCPVVTTNAGVVTYDWPIPWPQGKAGGTWRVDAPDISGTTLTIDALFIKN